MEISKVLFLLCLLVFTKAEVGVSQNKFTTEQQNELDSLYQIINTTVEDTTKVNSLLELAEYYYLNNLDTTIIICQTAEKIAEKTDYKSGLSSSYAWLGYLLNKRGDLEKTMEYNFKSLEITQEIGDKEQESSILNNIGFVYHYQGNIPEALKYFISSMKIREEIGDKSGLATSLNNLASIYKNQGDKEKAIEYYDRSLALFSELSLEGGSGIDNKRVQVRILCNAGRLYLDLENTSKAELYYGESLDLGIEIDDKSGVAIALNHLGELEESKGNLIQAIDLYKQSLMSSNVVNSKREITASTLHLGRVYFTLGEYSESEKYATQSLSLSEELGSPLDIRNASNVLYKTYKETRKIDKSLEMFELHIKMRDSLSNEKNKKQALKQGLQYEYDKHKLVDSLENAKVHEIKDLEIKEHKAEIEREETKKYALFTGVGLLFLFGGMMYNRFRHTKKQKLIIEEQKEQSDKLRKRAETQTRLAEKNMDKAYMLKEGIEKHHKEIQDSINYAKRIQDALLKNEEHESPHLPPHFIYFQPKDIVSGDFYWAHEKQGYLYLSAADCTGHGVPGAFLTMLGTSFLNEINAGEKLLSPAEILNQLRDRFIKELSQNDGFGSSKDGMDISLIRLNLKTNELSWAGANNPLYLITAENPSIISKSEDRTRIKQNGRMISAILPNKQAIGYDYFMKPFTNHTIQLEKGDYLCLFSDGYADQFGGPKGKKFKYKPFKKLLMEVYEKPMVEQKEIISSRFEEWKGDLEQIDDVCIIGVRI